MLGRAGRREVVEPRRLAAVVTALDGEAQAAVVELVHPPAQKRVVAVDVDRERRAHAAILARRAAPLCAMRPGSTA
jgi:hypothetical protein